MVENTIWRTSTARKVPRAGDVNRQTGRTRRYCERKTRLGEWKCRNSSGLPCFATWERFPIWFVGSSSVTLDEYARILTHPGRNGCNPHAHKFGFSDGSRLAEHRRPQTRHGVLQETSSADYQENKRTFAS